MKKLILTIAFLFVTSLAFGATYEGRAEKIIANDRGITFEMVVVDKDTSKEVYRREVYIGTGNQTGEETKAAILAYVDKTTALIYNHIEGGKVVETDKTTLESYRKEVNKYTDLGAISE